MIDVDSLKFDENGLIPAIVFDYYEQKVLMLAYMTKETLIDRLSQLIQY